MRIKFFARDNTTDDHTHATGPNGYRIESEWTGVDWSDTALESSL